MISCCMVYKAPFRLRHFVWGYDHGANAMSSNTSISAIARAGIVLASSVIAVWIFVVMLLRPAKIPSAFLRPESLVSEP